MRFFHVFFKNVDEPFLKSQSPPKHYNGLGVRIRIRVRSGVKINVGVRAGVRGTVRVRL